MPARPLALFQRAFVLFFALLFAAVAHAAPGTYLGATLTPFPGGDNGAHRVVIQPDGKMIVIGFAQFGTQQYSMTRYNTDGSVDTSYGQNRNGTQLEPLGPGNGQAWGAGLQSDGKLVVAGFVISDKSRFGIARFNTDGTLDVSFGGGGAATTIGPGDSGAYAMGIQGDGKIVLGGFSIGPTGKQVFTLARYNTNATIDTSFGSSGFAVFPEGASNEQIRALTINSDGTIVVAGLGNTYLKYARVTSSGAIDTTFAGGAGMATVASVNGAGDMSQQSDGKYVMVGSAPKTVGTSVALVRVNTDGTLDTAFGTNGVATASIGSSAVGWGVVALGNGQIAVSGSGSISTNSNAFLARFNSNGALDTTFGTNSGFTPTTFTGNDQGVGMALRPNGGFVVVGQGPGQGIDSLTMAFTGNGAVDNGFNGTGYSLLDTGGALAAGYASAKQGDGKILVAGTVFTAAKDGGESALVRYNTDGTLDTTFGTGGFTLFNVHHTDAVAIAGTGKIVTAGYTLGGSNNATHSMAFARFNADGTLDTTFGTGGIVAIAPSSTQEEINGVAVLSDGSVIGAGLKSGGQFLDSIVVKLTPAGALDTTFNGSGSAVLSMSTGSDQFNGVGIQSDGKIVATGWLEVSGSQDSFGVARFNTNGTLDTAFGTNGFATISYGTQTAHANAMLIQAADGKIVAGGQVFGSSTWDFALARLNTNGTLDTTFGTGGKVQSDFGNHNIVFALAQLGNGDILAAGTNGDLFGLAQYLPNGALDTSFGNNGVVTQQVNAGSPDDAYGVTIGSDGTIYAAGNASNLFGLARFSGGSGTLATATVNLASSGNPSNAGQSVTFTATITGSVGTPTGTVTFKDGANAIAGCSSVVVTNGAAACSTSTLTAGAHTITAAYSGNGSYNPASASLTQNVNSTAVNATVSLASSGNPSTSGASVTFTATVSGSAGTPTGTVTFNDGSAAICSAVALNGAGSAACSTSSLSVGSHSITAAYSGSGSYNAATSSVLTQTVQSTTSTETNFALASNGGFASASSQYNSGFPIAAVNNGDATGANWTNGGGWADGTLNAFPDWVQIDFNGSKSIDKVVVYTLQDNWQNPVQPTDTMTFTQYGITAFDVQAWNGSAWTTVASITGNNLVKRTVTFPAVTTSKIRISVNAALNSLSRITEVEAWGTGSTTATSTNVALAANGATAIGSSQYNSGFPVAAVINGDESGANWTNGGGWADGTLNQFPDWVEVDFAQASQIDHVVVTTVQDNWQNPVQPSDTMTFTQYGITAFDVQVWNGSSWTTVGSITGNNLVKRTVSFAAVTTSKVRIVVNSALNSLSRITEIEAWSVGGTPPPPAATNVALASNGSSASASSQYGSGFPVAAIINGDATGANWTNGGGWADGTLNQFPDWVQINFPAQESLTKVVVYTVQDNWQNPVQPTDTMTFTQYGITDFDVQGWDGTQWVTLASVTGNNLVKRTVTFNAFTTSQIRISVKSALNSLSRITEVEAWGVPVGGSTNVALASSGATAMASSQYSSGFPVAAVIDGDRKGLNWSNGGGWADGTLNQFPDWVEVDFNGAKTLNTVNVYTVQDNWQNPVEPTDTMTFTQYGIVDFTVQAWNGSSWQTIGTASGNNLVKRSFPVSVTTTKIRVNITSALNSLSRITEIEALGN